MINYIEKGAGLHAKINESGYSIWHTNGICYSSNDEEVQKIIDEYDPLPEAKNKKKKEILKDSSDFLNTVILDKYPRFEIDTWQNQLADALKYKADNNAITITLDALSLARGVDKNTTADRIIAKAQQFAAFSATYAGERQRLEDLVDAAISVEEILQINFKAL